MRARNVNLIITHDVQLTTTIMSGFRRMADIGDRDGYATRTHTRVQKAREELICPICIETFKEPRTLACQHTFCTACLEQLASSHKRSPLVRRIPEKCGPEASCDIRTATTEVTVSCPECRTNITLPENGINGLPKNFKLERFIEILSPLEREELNRTVRKRSANRCLSHPKKKAEYYCNTCSTLACGDCLVEHHLNHEVKRAVEVLPEHMQALNEFIPAAEEILKSGEASLSSLQPCSESLNEQGAQAVHNIEAYFAKIRDILSKREAELKGEVKAQVKSGQIEIEENEQALEKSVKQLRECVEELEQMVQSPSFDILMKEKQLKCHLQSSQESLIESCKSAAALQTLSIRTPPLEDARLEILCRTLASEAPVPLPRKKKVETHSTLLYRTDSTQSDGYALTPDVKRLDETNDEPVEDCSDPLPPAVPLRNQSCNYDSAILEPDVVWGAQNLSASFFRTATGCVYPRGVCCGPSNTYIVTDVQNHCFRILTSTGKCLDVIGKEGKNDGMFGEPTSVTVDHEGNLLVADLSPARVQKFTPEGKYLTKLSGRLLRGSPFGEPWGVAVNHDGKIFVSDWDKSCIHTYNQNGQYTGNFGTEGVEVPLKYPAGIAIDKRGRIIVADRGNHVVWIFTPDGNLLLRFGKVGHAPGELFFPFGVAVNREGTKIFISESGNHRVSVFDAHGVFLHCFGKKGSEPGKFNLPRHMCIDPLGRLVVSDEQNQRLQIFNSNCTK